MMRPGVYRTRGKSGYTLYVGMSLEDIRASHHREIAILKADNLRMQRQIEINQREIDDLEKLLEGKPKP